MSAFGRVPRHRGAGLLLLALLSIPLAPAASLAQSGPAPAEDPVVIVHGNHCGWGTRGAHLRPVDALDAACRRHDRCWARVGPHACACHEALAAEAGAIAQDAEASSGLREKAWTISALFQVLPCNAP